MIADQRLSVPAHFDAEVYAVFRRLFRNHLLARGRLDLIARRLIALAAERVSLPALLPAAHALADAVSASDAFYLALARVQDADLLTFDARLAKAATRLARVRLMTV